MVNFIDGKICVVCVNCEVRAPTTRRLKRHSIDAAAAQVMKQWSDTNMMSSLGLGIKGLVSSWYSIALD